MLNIFIRQEYLGDFSMEWMLQMIGVTGTIFLIMFSAINVFFNSNGQQLVVCKCTDKK